LMIEMLCGDSMIGVAVFVVEAAVEKPVAVTIISSFGSLALLSPLTS